MRKLRNIFNKEEGSAVVEFTVIFPLLLGLTFSIVELGNLYWEWNAAEKATEVGVRIAVTRDTVITGLNDCGVANVTLGTNCRSVPGSDTWTASCTAGTCSAVPFAAIVTAMQGVYDKIQPANVLITYRGVGLGFEGRGTPVPLVTVSLQNMTFNFVTMGDLFGFGNVTLPAFPSSLTGEDLTG